MTSIEKIVFAFFILAYYLFFIKIIDFILPGFLVLSNISTIGIIVLVILVIPSFFASKLTVKYLVEKDD